MNPKSLPSVIWQELKPLHSTARETILEGKEIPAAIFRYKFKENETIRELMFVNNLMQNSLTKELVRIMMETAVAEEDTDFVIFLTEVWMATIAPEEVHTIGKIKIKDRPDKQEAVLASIMTKTKQFIVVAHISRNPNAVGEFELLSEEGRMEGLLIRDEDDAAKFN